MHTPGRCTNTETCWVGNAGRTVQVVLGADFVCPACQQPLRPPVLRRVSVFKAVRATGAFVIGTVFVGAIGAGAAGLAGNEAVNKAVAQATGHRIALADLLPTHASTPARPTPQLATLRREPLLVPLVHHVPTSVAAAIGMESAASATQDVTRPARSTPERGAHYWLWAAEKSVAALNGRGWTADIAPEPRAPATAETASTFTSTGPEAEPARPPAVVSNELAVVPPPKPAGSGDAFTPQAPEAVRPPALFGRVTSASDSAPPAAQLADLPVSAVTEGTISEPSVYAASGTHPPARDASGHLRRAPRPDALRVALTAQTEHVTLPVAAAPALPRYPALFAQEYPAGRVSAVCLLAAAGEKPDCKVLNTGVSLSMTESVGAWPKAGQVHYRAIAANARRAEAAWKPDRVHSGA